MNILRGLGTFILSFLLFLSLTVFGMVFLLHSTLLNPDFVTTELNRLNIASLLTEAIEESGQGQGGLSQELKTSLLNTATKLEPVLKKQANAAIYPIYDYLRGERPELQLDIVIGNTVASNDFLITVIDNLDTASLVKGIIAESDSEEPGGLPKELTTAVTNILTKLEPQLKKEVSAAISPINDYLWERRQDLSLAVVLSDTVLRTDFVVSIINEVDIAALTRNYISSQLNEAVPIDTPEVTEYLTRSLDEIITKLEPWLKQQLSIAAGPCLDYLLGKTQTVNVTISVAPALTVVKDTLKDDFMASPPAEVMGVSRAKQEQYFDNLFAQFSSNLPSTFTFDEKLLASTRDEMAQALAQAEEQLFEARDKLAQGLAEAEAPLAQAREYIGYFQTGYYLLIALMVVLVAGIFLVNWNVSKAALALGIDLTLYGVLELAGVIFARTFIPMKLLPNMPDIPASLETWLNGLFKDLLAPLQLLSIVIIVIGIALIVASFFFKRKVTEAQE